MNQFNPSPEQAAFFQELVEGPDNLILEAVAGSGKTTTIVHGTRLLPLGKTIKFLAFNKDIASELAGRLPSSCQAKTFHAEGFASLRNFFGKSPKVDGSKCQTLLKDILKDRREFELYFSFVSRLVGLAKNVGVGPLVEDKPSVWYEIISQFNLQLESDDAAENFAIDYAQRLLHKSNEVARDVIDFDDMLYVPLLVNSRFDKCNYVFIDEAQDTNAVQRALLHKLLAPDGLGRLIAVGDPNQAIYAFRGADSDAMDLLKEEFNMKTLPLSVSYRCSKAVVREAQKYCK